MVKHAAREDSAAAHRRGAGRPRLRASDREARRSRPSSRQWLDRIRQHLVSNLSIDRDDFDILPVLVGPRRLGRAQDSAFGATASTDLLHDLNEAIAA